MNLQILEDTNELIKIIEKEQYKILKLSEDKIIPATANLYNDIYKTHNGNYKSKSIDIIGSNYTYIIILDTYNNLHISSNCKNENEIYEILNKLIQQYNPNKIFGYLYVDCELENYIKKYDKYYDNFVSSPDERLEYMNSEWLKKHKLNNIINDFEIRELNDNTKEIELAYLEEFKKTKKDNMSFYKMYKNIINNNLLNNRVGIFYKDLLLGYREAMIIDNISYNITENCISNIKTDFSEKISSLYSKYKCLDRLKSMIIDSNLIADEIVKLKENKKWKQAKELTKNKKFIATLEKPYEINKKEVLLELLKKYENSDKLFLKTNIKHLFMYKYNEYMKSKGIKYFTVDVAVNKELYEYKIKTNTFTVKYTQYTRRKNEV